MDATTNNQKKKIIRSTTTKVQQQQQQQQQRRLSELKLNLGRIQRELDELQQHRDDDEENPNTPGYYWVTVKGSTSTGQNNNNTKEFLRFSLGDDEQTNVNTMNQFEKYAERQRHWKVTLSGPTGTPYQGGIFFLNVDLPESYPFKPPIVTFQTPIYHANVRSGDGSVCMDVISREWSPALTVSRVLLSLISLLHDPEEEEKEKETEPSQNNNNQKNSSQQSHQHHHQLSSDVHRQNLFASDRAEYERMAREWTVKYAT